MSNSHPKSILTKLAGLGSVGMLLGLDSATAIKVSQKASVSAGLSQQIQSLSQAVEQSLLESGELASLMNDAEMRALVSDEVHQAVTEELIAPTDQKTNLEEANPATPKHAKKHHHKHKHSKKDLHSEAPKQTSNLASSTMQQNVLDSQSQPVTVPIDEVRAITMKVSPTFARDTIESVTLKAFRKVIGYDTFNSILKNNRDEVKDSADHYNITVSMMVRRDPEILAYANGTDPYSSGQPRLVDSLDKGFPYDDGDNTISDAAPAYVRTPREPDNSLLLGKLNGENITSGALKNLVRDTEVPITQQLVQLESDIELTTSGDSDNVFKLMDSNVTKGQMKNLITDKPAPITVKLAQTAGDGDNVFKLMDSNVTKGQMKNLITDKPAPITVKLAQTSGDGDNVFKLMDSNVTKGQMKNLITDKPAPITVKLAQTSGDGDNVFKLMDSNVTKGQMKNLITDKPAPITVKLAQKSSEKPAEDKTKVNAVQTQQLAVKAQAQQMMSKVKTYCDCQNHNLAQKKHKQDNETYELGDEVCTPVTEVSGVDCTMDGFNVTVSDLEGIITDRPAPITLPLDPELAKKKQEKSTTLSQIKGDGEDAPTEEDEDKAEEAANSAATVTHAAIDALATNQLENQGVIAQPAKDGKMVDPMNGKVVDVVLHVGGSKVDLSQATFEKQKAAKEKAKDDAVKELAIKQDQQ